MNCKLGDLAVYVGKEAPEANGQLVTVVRSIGSYWPKGQAWHVEPGLNTRKRNPHHVFDIALKPIRDPGDDARDETLSWKPVPKEDNLSKEDAELLIEALRQWAKEQA